MIIAAGESLIDLVIDSSGAITPRAGGSPYNTARSIARLGGECSFLGRFGNDRFGRLLRSGLLEDGVALAYPDPVDAPTTLALAEIGEDGNASYHFYMAETAAASLSEADAVAALARLDSTAGGARTVHLASLGLVMEPIGSALEALVGALPADVLLSVDPNCRPLAVADDTAYRGRLDRLARRADVMKVSDADLAYMAPGMSVDAAARALVERGVGAVLVTRGSEPAAAYTVAGTVEVAVPSVRVADTIGAGDSFGGAFLTWWSRQGLGRDDVRNLDALRAALDFAVSVAAITCQRVGADPPRLADLGEQSRMAWSRG